MSLQPLRTNVAYLFTTDDWTYEVIDLEGTCKKAFWSPDSRAILYIEEEQSKVRNKKLRLYVSRVRDVLRRASMCLEHSLSHGVAGFASAAIRLRDIFEHKPDMRDTLLSDDDYIHDFAMDPSGSRMSVALHGSAFLLLFKTTFYPDFNISYLYD